MKLFALMTVKNEADRFLLAALKHAQSYADEVFVYDDQSNDLTYEIARDYASHVEVRPDTVPTFMEHEGRFRQAALDRMVEIMGVSDGDWVHVVDADEFLTSSWPLRQRVRNVIRSAVKLGCKSVKIPIPTVWGGTIKDGILTAPLVRTDRFWNTLAEPRFWRFEYGARFLDRPMACRNEPTYVRMAPIMSHKTVGVESLGLFQMHYGYAFPEDRTVRYDRYSGLEDHGHHPEFIKSIIQTAPVAPWNGPWFPVRRGHR